MGRLFGTDGARGVANTELTCETAMSIGRAAAMVLIEVEHRRPRVLIGKDTRVSSDMLEAALVAGLCSVGADVQLLGVVPTPAVAYLVGKYQADAGIMISASHNPCEYNGIKIFNGEGYKLSDNLEEEIEAIVLDGAQTPPTPTGGGIGRVSRCDHAVDDYVRHLLDVTDVDLRGMRLAVDEQGNLIDGDKIIAALAMDMKEKGELDGNAAVVTVMSNLGFFRFCEQNGITPVSTKVGDRYVLEEMVNSGYAIGGEQSGHIIFRHHATTGDGQMSAVKLLAMAREKGVKLSRIGGMMERYPQVIINVKADAAQKAKYAADKALAEEISKANASLGRDGRVLVRVSGTEPLLRIMVEGREFDAINDLAVQLGETIKAAIQ